MPPLVTKLQHLYVIFHFVLQMLSLYFGYLPITFPKYKNIFLIIEFPLSLSISQSHHLLLLLVLFQKYEFFLIILHVPSMIIEIKIPYGLSLHIFGKCLQIYLLLSLFLYQDHIFSHGDGPLQYKLLHFTISFLLVFLPQNLGLSSWSIFVFIVSTQISKFL